jgi:putative hydrolase of the HAD superfamily
MRYRLLCLDAGFTLLAPKRTLGDALRGVLAEHGHEVTEAQVHRAWEVADRWFWGEYHRPGNQIWTDDERIDAVWRHYHDLMLSELGLGDLRHRLIDLILEAQYAPDNWELYPDVLPMLEALRASHGPELRTGIVSDWGSNLRPIISAVGLDPHLDFVLASGAVGVAKPDPAFFRLAADAAGVDPAEGVMVGDSYFGDVEGARSAGMEGILLMRPEWRDRREPPPEGTTVIASLTELVELLA